MSFNKAILREFVSDETVLGHIVCNVCFVLYIVSVELTHMQAYEKDLHSSSARHKLSLWTCQTHSN